MRYYSLFIIILATSLYSTNCYLVNKESVTKVGPPQKYSQIFPEHITATLREGIEQITNANETKISFTDEFHYTQFLNVNTGWIGGPKSLYKTSDGGQTWQRLDIELPADTDMSSFSFIDEKQGWLAIAQKKSESRGLGYSSHIMATRDGGNTWTEQSVYEDNTKIKYLEFLDANRGLAIGEKVIDAQPEYVEIFVASTNDGGGTWDNLSGKVNSTIKTEYGTASDYGANFYRKTPSNILLLTGLGRIIKSSDNGRSWETIAQIKDEYPQTGYLKINLTRDGKTEIISGASGHGYWGNLIIEDSVNKWISYDLLRVPLFDAIFLSDNEIIACGSQAQSFDNIAQHDSGQPLAGVILHSIDSGRTWSVIYRSKLSHAYIALIHVAGNHFMAIGSNGSFLRFDLQGK